MECLDVLFSVHLAPCKCICNIRTEKSAGKKSDARGRSRQRKAKAVKNYAEEEDDEEEGTYILLINQFYYISILS